MRKITSAVLTPFMRQLIRRIERTDVLVHPYSCLRCLDIDSLELHYKNDIPSNPRLYGLPLSVTQDLRPPRIRGRVRNRNQHLGLVVARFDARAPEGISLRQAKRHLVTTAEGLKEADPLLVARGYRRVITSQRPADFMPIGKKFAAFARYRVLRFTYFKDNVTAREAVKEVEWFLLHARHFWPNKPWKK